MKKKLFVLMLAATMTLSCVACGSKTSNKEDKSSTKATESLAVMDTEEVSEVPAQDIKVDDLKDLTDKGVITGVKDITVEEGTDVDLNELVYADKDIVKSVDIDDSAVDYSKAGTYEVIYTITFNGDKFRDYVDENNINVGFDTDGDTIVVKTTVTVTVATKEDTEKAIESGDTSVVTEETKESVKNDNKSKANDNAVVSTPSKTGNSTGNGNNNSGANNSANAGANSGANNGANNSNNKPADTPKDNTNNKPSDTPKNDTPSKPSEPAHTHNYVEVSHTDATCTASGTVTKKCSCGATITENSGNALGHNFVHHDAVTHTEQKLVKDAYDDSKYEDRYVCGGCGATFKSDDAALEHIMKDFFDNCENYHTDEIKVSGGYHDAVYETVTVTDTPAYDECSRCGARK